MALSPAAAAVITTTATATMRRTALVAAATGLILPSSLASSLAGRQDDPATNGPVPPECYPTSEVAPGGTRPPCPELWAIEAACEPSGTGQAALDRHAQCMCQGSYFDDYVGCQSCLRVHGTRSERDTNYWNSVLAVASSALCGGSPTAVFPEVFSSVQADPNAVPQPTSGATQTSNQYPGQTDVSLYYTATRSQGAGIPAGSGAGLGASAPTGGASLTSGASATIGASATRVAPAATSIVLAPSDASTTRAPLTTPAFGGNRTTATTSRSTTSSTPATAAAPTHCVQPLLAAALAGAALLAAI